MVKPNILLDNLPTQTPNGFKIRTDFRNVIKFELLMQDNKIKDDKKISLALNLFFDIEFNSIEMIQNGINDILWFYRCGEEIKTSRKR